MKLFNAILISTVLLTPYFIYSQTNLSGSWDAVHYSNENETYKYSTYHLTQSGNSVTGYRENSNGFIDNIDGSVSGNTFSYRIDHSSYTYDWNGVCAVSENFASGTYLTNASQNPDGLVYLAKQSQTNINNTNKNLISFKLLGNYPNPFNPETKIAYTINKHGNVILEIYNVNGRLIRTLVNRLQKPGQYEIRWNGLNENNQTVPSGMYMYKLSLDNKILTGKAILLK
ncbi:MAG: FlgD immunoglobulin-like domain containing protein [bacterium]